MNWILIFLSIFYFMVILYFFVGIIRVNHVKNKNSLRVTVLVPARNEAKNILGCLESLWSQSYPQNLYEVIVVDDNSQDNTAEVVEKYISDKANFRLLRHIDDGRQPTYKKQALSYGLQFVQSEIIMTIDADTIANNLWIEKMLDQFDDSTGLVAGLVTFSQNSERSLFHKIQTLEFAGIVFCGVGSMGNNNPIICNGSNLSYRMKAFQDAGGYDGYLHLPSGDDDLLLQKIKEKTSWSVKYSLDKDTINFTHPVDSIKTFLNQRARWTSKSLHYPSKTLFPVMSLIYIFYLLMLVLLPLSILGLFPIKYYILAFLLKIVPEVLIIYKALRIFNRRELIVLFPIAQFFQMSYIIIAGFRGFFNKFSWKDPNNAK